MRSTGYVLAAGAIAAANEVVFAPAVDVSKHNTGNRHQFANDAAANFNWRIVPATLVLAAVLGGFETIAPDFAVGLGRLVVGAVLLLPVGNAKSPIENIVTTLGY